MQTVQNVFAASCLVLNYLPMSPKMDARLKWVYFIYTLYNMDCFCVLSCQPRVTATSCFVYKVIRDLESVDYICINPIRRIGLIHKYSINSR